MAVAKDTNIHKTIYINQQPIKPGQHAQINLNIYRLPTRTVIEIPTFVYRTLHEGPTILFLAGMHGDEINGIEIIRRLVTDNTFKALTRGTVIAIPIINIVSFLDGKRDLPDGRDLNRCFPGSRSGSLGSQIAYDLMNEIIPQVDFGVDFHTGGAKINNHPQIRCVFDDPKNVELAKKFGAPLTINSTYREKTLRKEAERKGKPILVFEGGESCRFDPLSIQEGLNGCLRLLRRLDMIEADVPEKDSIILQRSTWIRAKYSGLFHSIKPNGSHVKKNEIIGKICDPYGESEYKLRSPENGYIVGINNQPVIHQGDALIHIGLER